MKMNDRIPPFYSFPPPPPPPFPQTSTNYQNLYTSPPPPPPPQPWSNSQQIVKIQNQSPLGKAQSSSWERSNYIQVEKIPSPTTNWERKNQGSSSQNNHQSLSPNSWDRNNSRNNWKQNRTRNRYSNPLPYTVPKKLFTNRYQQNRNGTSTSYYENSLGKNWTNNRKSQSSPQGDSNKSMDNTDEIPGIIQNKKKRKPMSKSYPSSKWDEKDALKALQAEKEYAKTLTNQSLIIKFPDPELGKDMVKEFHSAIENVHFPQPSTPRYCFAHLKEDSNIDEVVATLEKIPFGQGFLSVELKKQREDNLEVSPKDIDPYTLYVGNLPLNVTKAGIKSHFKDCTRLDIGHPQQMKNTRYAFVRFSNVDDAIRAYKSTFNTLYDSRSMIVRFRRMNGNVAVPGETSNKQTQQQKQKTDEISTSTTPEIESISRSSEIQNISTPKSLPQNSTTKNSRSESSAEAPDLSLVKDEPTSDNEEFEDVKPLLINGVPVPAEKQKSTYTPANYANMPIKTENDYIKTEPFQCKNEDDMDDVDEVEDDYDYSKDNFRYDGMQEETEDFEEDDEYDYEDLGLETNEHNFLPGDDDEDLFQ